jgi:2-polyprenyl-6-methoxyphenol hydroxylase-like FAD-dependent oxidoreductase
MAPLNQPNVAVVGAGVIGLTTAIILQAAGAKVILIAEHFPDQYSEDSLNYASPKAGAHWRSVAEPDNTYLQGTLCSLSKAH